MPVAVPSLVEILILAGRFALAEREQGLDELDSDEHGWSYTTGYYDARASRWGVFDPDYLPGAFSRAFRYQRAAG